MDIAKAFDGTLRQAVEEVISSEEEIKYNKLRKLKIGYHLEDGQLHVHTNNGDWRIIVNGKSNRLFLYHKNTFQKEEKIPSIIPGFHSQAIRYSTILEYLEYIVQHDAFRRREKKKSERKAKSMRELRRNTRQFHRGTDTRRFNANQLYSIMDGIYL